MKPLGTQHIAEFLYCSRRIINDRRALVKILREGIKKSGLTLLSVRVHVFKPVGMTIIGVLGESHIAMHTYPEARHVSLDIYTCSPNPEPHFKLLSFLKKKIKPKTVRIIELLRGNPIEIKQKNWIASSTAYGFDIRYHVVKSLVSKRSKYRQIDLIENDCFGKMLFMDRDVRISERDASVYAMNMVEPVKKAGSRISRVAVFGAEDGGATARELLRSTKVKEIVIVEFDRDLFMAVREHMKSIHRGVFKNAKVNVVITEIGDFFRSQRGFDAALFNFSMHPEALTRKDRTEFLRSRFQSIKDILKPRGIVSFECCSEYDIETKKLVKRLLARNYKDIVFRSEFISSYCENWTFVSGKVRLT